MSLRAELGTDVLYHSILKYLHHIGMIDANSKTKEQNVVKQLGSDEF